MELCLLIVNKLSYSYYFLSVGRMWKRQFVSKKEVYATIPQMALKCITTFLSVGWMWKSQSLSTKKRYT